MGQTNVIFLLVLRLLTILIVVLFTFVQRFTLKFLAEVKYIKVGYTKMVVQPEKIFVVLYNDLIDYFMGVWKHISLTENRSIKWVALCQQWQM